MKTALALLLAVFSTGALAKLPPPGPEAQAKAAEASARTAWAGKVDGYKLCQAQNKTAAVYFASARAAGKTVHEPASMPPCADPGPFVYTPPEAKPLEAAGAHSPAETAKAPPNTAAPDAATPKQ